MASNNAGAATGGGVLAFAENPPFEPELSATPFSGGNMVRAVSSGKGSRAAGFTSAFGAALISFPQPRQNL